MAAFRRSSCHGVAWVLTGKPLNVVVVVSIMLVSVVVVLALQAVLNHQPMQRLGTGHADVSDRKEWTKVGLQLGATLIFVQFSRDLTVVTSSLTLAPEDVAVIGIASAIVGLAKFFVVAVNQSMTPKISAAIADGNTTALMQRVAITNHLKFWPMLLVFFVFWALGDYVGIFFGPNFENIVPILLILTLEPLALAFFGPGGNILSLSGHQFVLLPLSIVTVLLLMSAVTIGAQFDGVRGVAIGSSFTWVFWSASLAVLTARYVKQDVTLVSSTRYLFRRRLAK